MAKKMCFDVTHITFVMNVRSCHSNVISVKKHSGSQKSAFAKQAVIVPKSGDLCLILLRENSETLPVPDTELAVETTPYNLLY